MDAVDSQSMAYPRQQQAEAHQLALHGGDIPDKHVRDFDDWSDHFFRVYSSDRLSLDETQEYLDQMIETFPINRFRDRFDELHNIYEAPPDNDERNRRRAILSQASIQARRR